MCLLSDVCRSLRHHLHQYQLRNKMTCFSLYTWKRTRYTLQLTPGMSRALLCNLISLETCVQQNSSRQTTVIGRNKAACAGRGAISCTAQDKGSAWGFARRWRQGTSDRLETLSLAEFGHSNNLQLDSICLPKGAFAIYRRQSGPWQACCAGQLQRL
jgi:hypothetical protein